MYTYELLLFTLCSWLTYDQFMAVHLLHACLKYQAVDHISLKSH